ncbi:MAG: F0F1 ATP synthase subunit epsilon [Candidatus Aminicenantes bacterium]|jgi:F-type H+-transporting ATPase subunit epsilon
MSETLPSSLELRVITSREVLVDERVEEVSLPSLEGYLGILPGHRKLIIALGKGRIEYHSARSKKHHAVNGGYARIQPDSVLVFTETEEDESS